MNIYQVWMTEHGVETYGGPGWTEDPPIFDIKADAGPFFNDHVQAMEYMQHNKGDAVQVATSCAQFMTGPRWEPFATRLRRYLTAEIDEAIEDTRG